MSIILSKWRLSENYNTETYLKIFRVKNTFQIFCIDKRFLVYNICIHMYNIYDVERWILLESYIHYCMRFYFIRLNLSKNFYSEKEMVSPL